MFELIERLGWLPAGLLSALLIVLRYALLAGSLFLIFYKVWHHHFADRKIQHRFPRWSTIRYEIRHSMETALVLAVMGLGIYGLDQMGWTRIYHDIDAYGTGYWWMSVGILILAHDTYFYWMHRLLHRRPWFQWLHRVHHRSFNPTPWSSLSFHPLEALLEFGIAPLAVVLMPVHTSALLVFATWSILFNMIGHLGYELFPRGFVRHPVFRWLNTSTHHNLHHARSNCNYGLYFNFWDRIMGTNAPDYARIFDKRASAKKQTYERP